MGGEQKQNELRNWCGVVVERFFGHYFLNILGGKIMASRLTLIGDAPHNQYEGTEGT